jgi:uncharacterized protein (DUF1786 family)
VLLFDDSKTIENCIKMVLPSPTLTYAAKIEKLTNRYLDLLIGGEVIGGSAVSSAIRKHLGKGLKVIMTRRAASTIRNDLDQVRSMGIQVVEDDSQLSRFNGAVVKLEEINLSQISEFLDRLGVQTEDIDVIAVAVQDHGVPSANQSNREFRMARMEEQLRRDPTLESLAFMENQVPSYFLRMRSAVEACKRQMPNSKTIVMDTAPSAVLGCLEDPEVGKKDRILIVNVGNGHTIAALMVGERTVGLLEHHTSALRSNPRKLEDLLTRFANGKIKGKDVFEDGGHGAFYLNDNVNEEKKLSLEDFEIITVTGPNRSIVANFNLPVHFASPAGDVMMTGTMGLVRAALRKLR